MAARKSRERMASIIYAFLSGGLRFCVGSVDVRGEVTLGTEELWPMDDASVACLVRRNSDFRGR